MKRYNLIKNIMTASVTSVLYYKYIVANAGMGTKVFAAVIIFVVIVLLLRDADKHFLRWEKKKSAQVGKP